MNYINPGQSQINSFSAQVIRLRPGFVAEQGSEFRAYIDNMPFCDKTDEEIAIVLPDDQTSHVEEAIFLNDDFSMKVFPNPSSGKVAFEFSNPGLYGLFNQLGQQIKTIEIGKENLQYSTEFLGEGFYYLVCLGKPATPVKFIIIK